MVASDIPPPMLTRRANLYELGPAQICRCQRNLSACEPGRNGQVERPFHPARTGVWVEQPDRQYLQSRPSTQAPGQRRYAAGPVDRRRHGDRPALNAIWLRGSPDYISRMKAMIAAIDIPLDSVILETQMVELTEQGQKALGIDFANANGQIGGRDLPDRPVHPARDSGRQSFEQRAVSGRPLRPDREGQRPHHLQAADCRAERVDRQDHHRRRASDPHRDHLVGRQRRVAAGSICECRRDAADRAAGHLRRLRLEPRLLRGVERHRLPARLSDDQPAPGRNVGHRARREFIRDRRPQPIRRSIPGTKSRCSATSRSSVRSSAPTRAAARRPSSTSSLRRTSCIAWDHQR